MMETYNVPADTAELNEVLIEEGFKGDIPEEIDDSAQIQFCEVDEHWLEGSLNAY